MENYLSVAIGLAGMACFMIGVVIMLIAHAKRQDHIDNDY